MLHARLEHELAFKQVAHALHHHFHERLAVVYALRHDDGRVGVGSFLLRLYGLARAFDIACCHACLKVYGGRRHGVVDVDICCCWHLALKVLALNEPYLYLAHYVLERKVDWRCRCLYALGGGEKQVAGLVATQGRGRLGRALVCAHTERLVAYAAHTLHVGIVGIGVVGAVVPIERSCGGPTAAVVGQCLVVHQVAAYLQRCIGLCHIQAYAVAVLKVGCCGTRLAWVRHRECHGRVPGILILLFAIVGTGRKAQYGHHEGYAAYKMFLHVSKCKITQFFLLHTMS